MRRPAEPALLPAEVPVAGCLIWTVMKMAGNRGCGAGGFGEAGGGDGHDGSWFAMPARVSGDVVDVRSRVGEATSHDDVTGLVI